jgi:hypothetical protein
METTRPPRTDEEWSAWWETREPDLRFHDELCPRYDTDSRDDDTLCHCDLIKKVMERDAKAHSGLSGYYLVTKERYERLVEPSF